MDILSSFVENLKELIDEKNISVEELAKKVDITYSEIYRYMRKEYLPKLSNIIKIADYFNCSIDYLLGFIPFPENVSFKKTPPFNVTFQHLLAEHKTSRYKLSNDTEISINRIDDWYHGKFTPSVDKAIKLAKYFNCSLDGLFGRE